MLDLPKNETLPLRGDDGTIRADFVATVAAAIEAADAPTRRRCVA
jgi:hypothetical protein